MAAIDLIAKVDANRHCLSMSAARTLSAFRIAFGTTAFLLSGCANAEQQVAGHQYDVSSAHLIPKSDYPFFLPKSQDEGFIFVLNPEAELPQQRSVLVQNRVTVCERANGKGYVSRTVCSPKTVEWQGRGWRKTGDDTWWAYSPNTLAAADAPFVSCHKMQIEGHPGLCKASLPSGDLLLTISLNDDELHILGEMFQRAVSLLREWEV